MRPRGRSRCSASIARGARPGPGAAAERDPNDSRANRRRSASRTCSICPPMQDPEPARVDAPAHALPAGGLSERPGVATRCSAARWSGCRSSTATAPLSARAYGSFAALISSVLARLQEALSIRQARRRPRAQAQRDVGALGRVLPVGDVRVALEQAGRRKHRALSASIQYGLQSGDHCTPATAPRAASRTCSSAACRSPTCARTATPRWSCCTESTTPPIPSSCGRACELIDWLQGEQTPRQHARQRRSRRDSVHGRDPGARQSLVRVRLVHDADDAALPLRGFRRSLRIRADRGRAATVQRGLRDARRARDVLLARDQRLCMPTATPEQRAVYDARARGQCAKLLRALGGVVRRELSSTCSCSSRPSARGIARRTHRSRRSLRPRDRGGARAGFLNIEALGRRARGALLVRRRQAGLRASSTSRRRCTPTGCGARTARSPISARSTG